VKLGKEKGAKKKADNTGRREVSTKHGKTGEESTVERRRSLTGGNTSRKGRRSEKRGMRRRKDGNLVGTFNQGKGRCDKRGQPKNKKKKLWGGNRRKNGVLGAKKRRVPRAGGLTREKQEGGGGGHSRADAFSTKESDPNTKK